MTCFIITLSLLKALFSGRGFPVSASRWNRRLTSFRPECSLSLTREQNSFLCDYCVTTRKEYLLAGSQTTKPADWQSDCEGILSGVRVERGFPRPGSLSKRGSLWLRAPRWWVASSWPFPYLRPLPREGLSRFSVPLKSSAYLLSPWMQSIADLRIK